MILNVTAIIAALQNDNRGISTHQFQVRKHYLLGSSSGFSALDREMGTVSVRGSDSCRSGVVRVRLWSRGLVAGVTFGFGGGVGLSFRRADDSMGLGCGVQLPLITNVGGIPVLLSWIWGCGGRIKF